MTEKRNPGKREASRDSVQYPLERCSFQSPCCAGISTLRQNISMQKNKKMSCKVLTPAKHGDKFLHEILSQEARK